MPLQATSGAASYDAFGGGVPVVPNYIEDVYSTYVYTGVTGSNVTINNGINLSVNGGLIWSKGRNGANPNSLTDTVRGVANGLNSASIFSGLSSGISSFTTTGYVTNQAGSTNGSSSETYVSWTFQEQPKFFDIVTWTGSGANRTISHNLGSVPGCIMVKCLDDDLAWAVYHRSLANTEYLVLNSTAATATGATWWNSTTPTSTVFSLGTNSTVNGSAKTYVAYIFAHDAGGFGLTGTDNVISCGSFTTDASGNADVNLGYEPQWIMHKKSSSTGGWSMYDIMRGMTTKDAGGDAYLFANLTLAEGTDNVIYPTATGFGVQNQTASITSIYIAIRRGPMKVPTVGTSVYAPVLQNGGGTVTTNFPVDLAMGNAPAYGTGFSAFDRLRGSSTTSSKVLYPYSTDAELDLTTNGLGFANNTGYVDNAFGAVPRLYLNWRRAPSFFDEVCYTGTGVARTVTHNLTVAPELMIVKRRSSSADWPVYHVAMGATKYTFLDGSTELTGTMWNNTAPTSSVFSVNDSYYVNYAANTYVAYLFATCAGVSKVGSYTGTGALQTVNCGFTTGARFVLIHRIDSGSNNWWIYDSARGITSGNDPYLYLNSTAAEVTGTNYVDTDSTGFKVTAAAPAGLNASGGTYIFLAIA
jgi:hypothetical protein